MIVKNAIRHNRLIKKKIIFFFIICFEFQMGKLLPPYCDNPDNCKILFIRIDLVSKLKKETADLALHKTAAITNYVKIKIFYRLIPLFHFQ